MNRVLLLLFAVTGISYCQTTVVPQHVKENSHLYKEFSGGPTLRQRLATTSGNVKIETNRIEHEPDNPNINWNAYPNPYLIGLARNANLVVMATPVRSFSAATEDEKFIFTDFDMSVSEVLRNNSASHVSIGDTIVVTQPGGTITIDGRQVSATVTTFPPFKNGTQYLLFLKYLPESQSYKAEQKAVFEVTSTRVLTATSSAAQHHLDNKLLDKTAFLQEVSAAIAAVR